MSDQRRLTQINGIRPLHLLEQAKDDSKAPNALLKKRQHTKISDRPIPVNQSSLSFNPPPRTEKGSKRLKIAEAQVKYHEFMLLDQAGQATIGFDNTRNGDLVAIKRFTKTSSMSNSVMPSFTNKHVVSLKGMCYEDDQIIVNYELMDVSLRQVGAVARGRLKAFEIAAVCKEVVKQIPI